MSTKKLSRTVIEGGRTGSNKYDRRLSHSDQRAAERAFMADLRKDPEHFDEEMIERITPVYKGFTDKLRPMYRWIDAQVGRKWDDVRAEVFAKFDTRTTAGRHITFDHLLASIVETERDDRGFIAADIKTYSERYAEYYVDHDGLLQRNSVRNNNWKWNTAPQEELDAITSWLSGRIIGEKGGTYYWFHSLDGLWKCEWTRAIETTPYGIRQGLNSLKYFSQENGSYEETITLPETYFMGVRQEAVKRTGLHWKYIENPSGFKQRGALSKEEVKRFKSFPEGAQEEILAFAKGRF